MKKTLLLAASMLMGSMSAFAQWEMPVPAGTQMEPGETYYLYNTGVKQFYTEGNDWGTRASVEYSGMKVKIEQYIDPVLVGEDSIWDNKTYLIADSSMVKASWKYLFIDGEAYMYVDWNNQINRFFEISENGDGTYRFYGAAYNGEKGGAFTPSNYADCYVGVKIVNGVPDKVLTPILSSIDPDEGVVNCIDWIFVAPAEYERWLVKYATYEASQRLAAQLQTAEEKGVNVNDEKAIYNNTASTQEQMEAAIIAVAQKIAKAVEDMYSPSHPWDLDAEYLVNTTFDENFDGWESTTGCQNNTLATNKVDEDGGIHFQGKFWENWNGSSFNGKMHREIVNMPEGVYFFKLAAFASGNKDAYVFINGDSTEVTSSMPNDYTVLTIVSGTNTIDLGLKTVNKTNNWIGIDNAHLEYYGNNSESFKYVFEKIEKDAPVEYGDKTYCEKAAKTAYEQTLADGKKVETAEDAIAALAKFNEAKVAFAASIKAYQEYADMVAWAEQENNSIEDGELGDYLMMEAEDNLVNGLLTTEQVTAETERLKNWVDQLKKEVVKPGTSVTSLLSEPNFDKGNTGWQTDTSINTDLPKWEDHPAYTGIDPTLIKFGAANPNAERWNANFDYYQELSGLKNGVYQLQAQAFYRTQSNDAAYANRETDEILAWIYLNESKQTVANLMSEPDTINYPGGWQTPDVITNELGVEKPLYTPNSMDAARYAFNAGHYENSVYGVVTDGTLRVGIKSDGSIGDRWTLFDNFRLTYWGKDAQQLSSLLAEKIDEAKNISGDNLMAKETQSVLSKASSDATSAMRAQDGNDMFNAYVALIDAISEANKSIDIYNQLEQVSQQLETAVQTYAETANPTIYREVVAFCQEFFEAAETGDYSDQQAEEKMREAKGYITKLKLPANVTEASDENPIDVSELIDNAKYDEQDHMGWEGTLPSFTANNNPFYYNAEFYMKTFNYYFRIFGLLDGTYELSLDAFYRSGSIEDDFNSFMSDDPHAKQIAFLYATSGDNTASVGIMHEAAGSNEEPLNGGTGEDITGNGDQRIGYQPGNMETAGYYFDNGNYSGNKLIIKVEGEELTIGLKKDQVLQYDWLIMDNWTLTYFGANSSKEVSEDEATDVNDIQSAQKPVAVVYYNVNGVRTAAPQKGINIVKTTLSDGTVKVQKVLVK